MDDLSIDTGGRFDISSNPSTSSGEDGVRSGTKLALFFSVFAAMGLIAVVIGYGVYAEDENAKTWPTTSGTITDNFISSDWTSDSHGSGGHYSYYPNVVYIYQVGGTSYTGYRISVMSSGSSDSSYAQSVLDYYYVGASVTVHYDPNDPARSLLELGGAADYVFLIVGLVFTSIGVGGMALSLRSNRKDEEWNRCTDSATAYSMPPVQWEVSGMMDVEGDEHVLWQAKPIKSAFLLTGESSWAFAGGLFFFVFALFLTMFAIYLSAPIPPIAIGSVFMCIGLASIIYIPWKNSRMYEGTEYVLTDRRLIRREGGAVPTCHSLDLSTVGAVTVERGPIDTICRTGSISFTRGTNDLRAISDAREAREKILAAAARARTDHVMQNAY